MIEESENALRDAQRAKNVIMRGAGRQPKKAIEAKLAPVEDEIQFQRERMVFLLQIKDVKIPFYEKLPKDN